MSRGTKFDLIKTYKFYLKVLIHIKHVTEYKGTYFVTLCTLVSASPINYLHGTEAYFSS